MHGKKGAVILYGVIAGFLLGIALAFTSDVKTTKDFDIIGDISLMLIETSKEAEQILFYIDKSAEFSAYQAMYDLARNGGCNEKDEYLGYTLWNTNKNADDNRCFPGRESAKANFLKLFSINLNNFFSKNQLIKVTIANYNLNFKGDDLLGIATKTIKIPIDKNDGKSEPRGEYSIIPSFKVNLGYDFSDYNKLKNNAQELIELCKDKNFELCVRNNKPKIFNDEDFELLDNCESEEKEEFYEVSEYVKSCSYSKDESCICTKNNPSGKGSFEITQEDNNVIITNKNNPELKETIENAKLASDSYVYVSGASYVHKDTEGRVLISGYWDGKTCQPQPKTKFNFCVKSNKNKFYVYDEDDGKVALRDVIYKFALDFGEQKFSEEKFSVGKVSITEDIKQLFKGKRVIIASGCLDAQQEVFELTEKLGELISETDALVINTVTSQCKEEDTTSFTQKYVDSKQSNILLVLTAGEFDEGSIEFSAQNKKSEDMSNAILNKIFYFRGFSEFVQPAKDEIKPGIKNILSVTDLSTEIVFTDKKIKEENDYANAIFSGLVDYLITEESLEIATI